MKTQRKLLALLLTIVMMLTMSPVMAFADDADAASAQKCAVTKGCTLDAGHEGECVVGSGSADENSRSAEQGANDAKKSKVIPMAKSAGTEANVSAYEKLIADIDTAENGVETTVTLQDDITGMTTVQIITIPEGKNIALDMAGHKIAVVENFSGRPIVNKGTLTVKGNGTIDSSASANGGYGAIKNEGTLTIENGHFAGAKYADGSVIRNTGTGAVLTVNGGLFDGPLCTIYNEGTANLHGGKYVSTSCSTCAKNDGHEGAFSYALRNVTTDAKMYAYDGVEVIGTQGAISAAIGYLEVNGGAYKTVDCDKEHGAIFYPIYAAGEVGKVKCVINGGTFENMGTRVAVHLGNDNTGGDGGINADAISQINGGVFISKGDYAVAISPNTAKASIICGGTFSGLSDAAKAYVDPASVSMDSNGNVVVAPRTADDEDSVAQIGEGDSAKYYDTLQKAIDVAKDGDTVTLIKNIGLSNSLMIDKKITLDFNGKDITSTIDEPIVIAGDQQTVTLKGKGKLSTTSNNKGDAALMVSNNASAIIDGGLEIDGASYGVYTYGTLMINDAKVTAKECCLAVNGNAQVTLKESTHLEGWEGNSSNAIATQAANTGKTSVTIEGGTYIAHGKEWVSSAIYWADHGTLTIKGGTFSNPDANTQGAGIYQKNGTVNIEGGSFSARDALKLEWASDTTEISMNVQEGNFDGVRSGIYFKVGNGGSVNDMYNIAISGGHFVGGNDAIKDSTQDADFSITGGIFNSEVTQYVVDGKTTVKVEKNGSNPMYAVDNDYIAEAVEGAKEGDTVIVLKGNSVSGIPHGVKVVNNTGNDIEVNDEPVSNGETTTTKHDAVKYDAKPATATKPGNIEYWYCADCGKYFKDKDLTQEISQADTIIPALGGADKPSESGTDSPSTGDTNNIWLWLALMALAGAAGTTIVVYRKHSFNAKNTK